MVKGNTSDIFQEFDQYLSLEANLDYFYQTTVKLLGVQDAGILDISELKLKIAEYPPVEMFFYVFLADYEIYKASQVGINVGTDLKDTAKINIDNSRLMLIKAIDVAINYETK